MTAERRIRTAQAWVELRTDDPEAVSAEAVARRRLESARGLTRLRRFRVFEITGPLPNRPRLESLLHRSTQFYNPHKERLVVRFKPRDPVPAAPGARLALVTDRGETRRAAAERWWRHETGAEVVVREGVVWAATFEDGGEAAMRDLVVVRDRHHGLLAHPVHQDARLAAGAPPVPWMGDEAGAGETAP